MPNSKIVAGGEVLIDLTQDSVTPETLAAGKTAHDKAGNQITGTNTNDVDSSTATASVAEVLKGKTFAAGGEIKTGEMPNNGGKTYTISNADDIINIPIGFHDGSGTVSIAPEELEKLKNPQNIKNGVVIMGQPGQFTGEGEATAQAKEITPTFENQTVLPDEGIDYLSQVLVKSIPVTRTENAAGGITVTIG